MALVVHAANFGIRPKGAFQNNVERKLTNGLIRNGHQVLNFSDRDAAMAGSLLGPHRIGGGKYANKAFRDLCLNIRPEVLILGQTDIVRPETVADLRERLPAMRVLQWSVDALFEPGNIERLERNLPVVDASLVSTAGEALSPLSRPGKRLGFLPNPVDFSIEHGENHLNPDLPFDLFYACGNPADLREVGGKAWNMDQFMSALLAALPGIRPKLAGLMGHKGLGGAAYQEALESAAIGLNISRRSNQFLYSSDRLAHLAGNGLAVVIERATGYDQLFSDDEMVFYSSFDEVVAGIDRLARDPARRMALAAAGRARYHELFNERRVAQYALDVAFDRLDPAAYSWPTLYAPRLNVATTRVLNLMLAPAAGGLESMALYYHRALEAQGAQVLSVGIQGGWFDRALAGPAGGFAGLKAASPIDPRQGWALARIAKSFAPDVVLAHGSRGAALAVQALSRQDAPIAAVVHNFRARRAILRADLAICVSPAVGADVRARLPTARVAVVENFAPLQKTPPRADMAEPPHIGTLGRLHEEKGFDILIGAAAQLRDRGRAFHLSIAGEGPAAADLKEQTARLGLTSQVDFPGWVSPPGELLGKLDLFVCSSRTESFGLVVIEAMAAGAPVVATDIEGPRILLAGGRYGRLVPPEAPEALADAMATALDHSRASLEMARLAQAEAIAPYDMEAGATRLWAALKPLLDGR